MSTLESCPFCGHIHAMEPLASGTAAYCQRCGSRMAKHMPHGLARTAALSLAALLLYIPANLFPILRMDIYGAVSENTIWQGVVRLYESGEIVVAIVVFLASIAIPLLKLLGLAFLVAMSGFRLPHLQSFRLMIFRLIEMAGRWAMLDVFLLAVLVSLVKLHRLATIMPGEGLIAFTCVVVLTTLASASFDPKSIWDKQEALDHQPATTD